ncbi:MAG: hypothetical protein GEU74_16560, partial [Nitriliruptorales bacterium]|nr:hypothetical protein [Nitriliruptorales bacterium]
MSSLQAAMPGVPSAVLQWDNTYAWKAYSYDGREWGLPSAAQVGKFWTQLPAPRLVDPPSGTTIDTLTNELQIGLPT